MSQVSAKLLYLYERMVYTAHMELEFYAEDYEPWTEAQTILQARLDARESRKAARLERMEAHRTSHADGPPPETVPVGKASPELLHSGNGSGKMRYPFDRLEPGQSFFVKVRPPKKESMRVYCSKMGLTLNRYFRCAEREEDGKRVIEVARVW